MKKNPIKKATASKSAVSDSEYVATLVALKTRIEAAQVRAVSAVNRELLMLYWEIGKIIAERQEQSAWGSGVIEKLAEDLQKLFPGMGGFSRANIFRMRSFYRTYEIVSEPPRQLWELPIFAIPWWHNVILMTKIKDEEERLWYAQQALDHGKLSRGRLDNWDFG